MVWNRYIEDSLKGTARAKRRKGMCRRVVAEGGGGRGRAFQGIGVTFFVLTETKLSFSTSCPMLC